MGNRGDRGPFGPARGRLPSGVLNHRVIRNRDGESSPEAGTVAAAEDGRSGCEET